MRSIFLLFVLIFSIVVNANDFPARTSAISEQSLKHKIVIVYSGHNTLPSHVKIREGWQARLGKSKPENENVEVYEEYLDDIRLKIDESYDALFTELWKKRFANTKIDMVAAVGPTAENLLNRHLELFAGAPYYVISIAGLNQNKERLQNNIFKVIDVVTHVLPETERLFILLGEKTTPYHENLTEVITRIEPSISPKMKIEFLNNISYDELYERASHLPEKSALFYFPFGVDRLGERKIPFDVLQKLTQVSSVPIFVHDDTYLSLKVVGGYIRSIREEGDMIGRLMLGMEVPQTDKAYDAKVRGYFFNDAELKRWHILDENLPPNSTILNRPDSFFYTYRWHIVMLFAIFAEATLIVMLIRSLRHRKIMALELADERDHLEERVEQRTRELKESEAIVRNLAYYDPLTQLPNRRLLTDRFQQAISHCHREKNKFAVMVIDLDKFKAVNDTFGHAAGDELLKQVAERIKMRLRENDTVARLGGDEFVVLLADVHSLDDTARVANALIETLTKPFVLTQNSNAQIGTSIGITFYPEHGEDGDVLMDKADTALYQAKDNGRGCFAYYDEQKITTI